MNRLLAWLLARCSPSTPEEHARRDRALLERRTRAELVEEALAWRNLYEQRHEELLDLARMAGVADRRGWRIALQVWVQRKAEEAPPAGEAPR